MRRPRLKAPSDLPVAYYHCISRVVDRQFVLGQDEKEKFVQFMRLYEQFCGVRVVTYCIMSNHFHLLLEVPQLPAQLPDDTQLLSVLDAVYSEIGAGSIRQRLEFFRREKADTEAEAYRETFFARMWDVSAFMKLLKQRFTQWFNRLHHRKGTLWEERFKSVLVEGACTALTTMAAYIDLNPVRAGIVADPKDYRWSGYAEAVAGNQEARAGLQIITHEANSPQPSAEAILTEYRVRLFGADEETGLDEQGRPLRRGFTREEIAAVLAAKGQLSRLEMLRCRVRYFADGAVLGTRAFVNGVFAVNRDRFGPKRKNGARPMRGVESDGLCVLRDLRVQTLGWA